MFTIPQKMLNLCANLRKAYQALISTVFHNMPPLLKAFFFLALFLIMASIGSVLGLTIASYWCGLPLEDALKLLQQEIGAEEACSLKVMNVANQLFAFLGASLVFRVIFGKRSVNGFWLGMPNGTAWLLPLLALFSLPLIQAAYEVNTALIPEGGYLESVFLPKEALAEQMTEAMLAMSSWRDVLINLFVVALVPAVCEELAFRGVLQSQLAKGFKNVHAGIWASAFVFSFVHFQFYGFLPRLLLGAFFGYLVIYSGSLWSAIALHFLNNGTAVVGHYLASQYPSLELERLEDPQSNPMMVILAALGFTFLFWVVLQKSKWPTIRATYLERHEKDLSFDD